MKFPSNWYDRIFYLSWIGFVLVIILILVGCGAATPVKVIIEPTPILESTVTYEEIKVSYGRSCTVFYYAGTPFDVECP